MLLDQRLLDSLRDQGVDSLFPVQEEILNAPWEERDLCICAPTGSGKTLGYILPILQRLSKRIVVRLRALVVVPGRDLARQVYRVARPLAKAVDLKVRANALQTDCDILISTPGTLAEAVQHCKGLGLGHLEFLVIDEADRLLAQSFQNWLAVVLSAANSGRNKLPRIVAGSDAWKTPLRKILLSATLTKNPAKTAQVELNRPFFILSGTLPETLSHAYIVCSTEKEKLVAALHLLTAGAVSTLCFANAVDTAARLYRLLSSSGVSCALFTSSAHNRKAVLESFQNGSVPLLICSDAAARGLDLENVQRVLNYDISGSFKNYAHRVGRTARAGKTGTAITLLVKNQVFHFKKMARKADLKIKRRKFSQIEKNPAILEKIKL